jgi:hypothetical protein
LPNAGKPIGEHLRYVAVRDGVPNRNDRLPGLGTLLPQDRIGPGSCKTAFEILKPKCAATDNDPEVAEDPHRRCPNAFSALNPRRRGASIAWYGPFAHVATHCRFHRGADTGGGSTPWCPDSGRAAVLLYRRVLPHAHGARPELRHERQLFRHPAAALPARPRALHGGAGFCSRGGSAYGSQAIERARPVVCAAVSSEL